MSQTTRAMPAKLQGDSVAHLAVKIENFRGIKNVDLTFDGHTLLVGGNNVGKSTVCDALNLVLGPDPKGRNDHGLAHLDGAAYHTTDGNRPTSNRGVFRVDSR